jgi:hypothetical protein
MACTGNYLALRRGVFGGVSYDVAEYAEKAFLVTPVPCGVSWSN